MAVLSLPGVLASPVAAAPDPSPVTPTEAPSDVESGDSADAEGTTTPGDEAPPGEVEEPGGADGTGPEDSGDPLAIRIEQLTPGVLPDSGEVTIRGEVTNSSEDPWTDLAVYAATSATAVTTEAQLQDAEAPAGVEPGDYRRIVEPDLFELVGDLDPGESTPFQLQLPRKELGIPQTPGVYRLGVQVLGTEPAGRIDGADGRDRLLVTVAPRVKRKTPLAVVLQVRRRTIRTATGEVARTAGWERVLTREGRLTHLVGLLASARSFPVTAVLDPAVVEAVGSLAAGNPGLDLATQEVAGIAQATAADDEPPSDESPGASASASAPTEGAEDGSGGDGGSGSPEATGGTDTATLATAWLQRLRRLSGRVDVQSLPYGDLDVGAAVRQGDTELIGRSISSGISLLSGFGVQASGVLAPYSGLMGGATAEATPEGVPALVKQRSLVQAVVDEDGTEVLDTPATEVPAALVSVSGTPVWTYRGLRAGEGSGAGDSALTIRQRILARSAIQAITRPGEPVVAVLPPQWQPGAAWRASRFFTGLRQASWLTPTRLDELKSNGPQLVNPEPGEPGATEPTTALALRYPPVQLDREVPTRVFRAAQRLIRRGEVMGELVVDGDALSPLIERLAMLGLSVHSRGHTGATVSRLRASDDVLGALVREVEIQAPPFVRMSSEEGSFLVPVVNRLDVPVQVQLMPRVAEGGLRLEVPDPLVVGPGARRPIRVEATAETIGVRSVQLDLSTVSGDRLYPGPSLAIRSSQVARWVWLAMAIGSGILFITILVRIVRRVRRREAGQGSVLDRSEGAP